MPASATGPTVQLNAAARQREQALMMACGLDLGMLFVYLSIGIWADSLTIIADCTRGGLLLAMECVLLVVMRRIHRGKLNAYDYGAGKLEQILNLLIATAMGVSGLYLAFAAVTRWFWPVLHAHHGLDVAALVSLVNVALNAWAFRALWLAGRDGTSIIMTGQIRARAVKVMTSVVVTVTVAISALAADSQAMPIWLDALSESIGTGFIGLLMVQLCFSMWRDALPQLLDRTLDEARQHSINRALATSFDDFDDLVSVRSRVVGSLAIVDIKLGFQPGRPMGEVQKVADSITANLRALIPGALVTITPVATAPAT